MQWQTWEGKGSAAAEDQGTLLPCLCSCFTHPGHPNTGCASCIPPPPIPSLQFHVLICPATGSITMP